MRQVFATVSAAASLLVSSSQAQSIANKTSDVFRERLEALGLLGSHFGSVGVPATFDYVVVGGGECCSLALADQSMLNKLPRHRRLDHRQPLGGTPLGSSRRSW